MPETPTMQSNQSICGGRITVEHVKGTPRCTDTGPEEAVMAVEEEATTVMIAVRLQGLSTG